MKYNLKVEDFGKIKYANIEVSPLTLLVGDNNSGKSYLLSLLWSLHASNINWMLFRNLEDLDIKEYKDIYQQIRSMVEESRKETETRTRFGMDKFQVILNTILKKRKDVFVKSIFNYEGIGIGKLEIEIPMGQELVITSSYEGRILRYGYFWDGEKRTMGYADDISDEIIVSIMMERVLGWILGNKSTVDLDSVVYLPAARTGFVLAKDAINKVGRRTAYDVLDSEEIEEIQEVQPFTKPIMQFMDTLENLSVDRRGSYEAIAEWAEEIMAHGNIQYSGTNQKEIRYIPKGKKENLPLRTTSAVVTELAPLVMMLKYKKSIDMICYEEPEMCLHPQLQQEMGRLLIRLVNKGIPIIATTHSDIIIQHINNMCKLEEMGCPQELLQKIQFSKEDAIDIEKIAVYQLTDNGSYSEVEKITPTDGEFQIRTFSNALLNILNQTSEVQEFEMRQED